MDFKAKIAEKTDGEIRTFLDEIANGTSNYKSLHSLTEQIEHQYHGRFLVELIQNAHDALIGKKDRNNRISILLNEAEAEYGALYIANDGKPFSEANFESLCKLGQSSKDPEESIGNKGIGFRSVLQISHTPEIYSRSDMSSCEFDGFCFNFSPDVKNIYWPIIQCLLKESSKNVRSPLSTDSVIVDWSERRVDSFREKSGHHPQGWLEREFSVLSPYLLPLPIDHDVNNPILKEFISQGFATVLRLPLLSNEALDLTKKKIEDLNEHTILFLEKLTHLQVKDGRTNKTFKRKSYPLNDCQGDGHEVELECVFEHSGNSQSAWKRFWVWNRKVSGKKLSLAVKDLPGKWPELKSATVSLAVSPNEESEVGKLSIYLPTELNSGCSSYFNAPFYGNMSRTEINFDDPINKLFLGAIANIAVTDALNSLVKKKEFGARAIIDILAPSPNEEGERWWEVLTQGVQLEEERIILTDSGWKSMCEVNLLPCLEGMKVLNESLLRSMSEVPIIHEKIICKTEEIERLFERLGINCCISDGELANLIESSAQYLFNEDDFSDWNGFWKDIKTILHDNIDELVGKTIILGDDDQLHAGGERCSVFFRPQKEGGDDDDVLPGANLKIPKNLGPYIAFLSDKIQTQEVGEKGRNINNAIHGFLSSGLVEPKFGVEQILRNVLVKHTPELPIPYGAHEEDLCRDILQWGVKLVLNSRNSRDRTLRYLSKLPVPCLGGWFPIEEACFGLGWINSIGDDLEKYLSCAKTKESLEARSRLLSPPEHSNWGGIGESTFDLLKQAGVVDGLRPIMIGDEWGSTFVISGDDGKGVKIPEDVPPCFPENIWELYREHVHSTKRPNFSGSFPYEFTHVLGFPGLDAIDRLPEVIRYSLMNVLIASIPNWNGWVNSRYSKADSGQSHTEIVKSPLYYALFNLPWLIGLIEKETVQFSPKDRWYIPTPMLIGRSHHFSHLNLLPKAISRFLDNNSELEVSMKDLDMPKYDHEEETDNPRLLNDLAGSLSRPESITNHDVFLGHVRSAWKVFVPNENNTFPIRIVIRDKSNSLTAVIPSESEPIFLPDANDSIHNGLRLNNKPVIVIDNPRSSHDAKRLSENFREAFGSAILHASDLKVQVLVNGDEWRVTEPSPLLIEEMPWLPPIVLTIFAFHGVQSKGTGTKAFSEAMKHLRVAKYLCVERLETVLELKGEAIASTQLDALWFSKEHSLIGVEEVEDDLSLMSDALASLVDRADIDTPLQLILSNVNKYEEHFEEIFQNTFEKMKISINDYSQVKQEWLGDFGWRLQLLRPLILLFNPDYDLSVLDDIDEAQFESVLGTIPLGPLNVIQVTEMVQSAVDMRHFGQVVYNCIGEKGELSQWNEALSSLGEPLMRNENTDEEFYCHLFEAKIALRSIFRSVLHDDEDGEFQVLDRQMFEELKCPSDFSKMYWKVGFRLAMDVVARMLQEWETNIELVGAVKKANSVEDLHCRLKKLGLKPGIDPIETQAENKACFIEILIYIQKAAIAWHLKNSRDPAVWEFDPTNMWNELPKKVLSKEAYISNWKTLYCFGIIRKLDISSSCQEISKALETSDSLEAFRKHLGILEEEINDASKKLEQRKKVLDQKEKTVDVCGKEFVNDAPNLGCLFDHITQQIEDGSLPDINLRRTEILLDLPSRRSRPTNKRKKGKGGRIKRPSQEMKNLVGLAGEIHAYRILKKKFGEVFGPSCWVSENSLAKFPENHADDGRGCDFEIVHNNQTLCFEVKASQGDDETFELGSSEVRQAINSTKGRNKRYFILHILNALSDSPDYFLLPNPYDKKNSGKYRFEGSGIRLRYLPKEKG